LKKRNLLRQGKNPDRLCMRNTLRVLDFSPSLHLTLFERPAGSDFCNSLLAPALRGRHFLFRGA